MQLAMPDRAVTGVTVEGALTGATSRYHGRIVTVDNPQHQRALRELGAFPTNLGGQPGGGYRCGCCHFGSYFKRCGRCGSRCVPDVGRARTDDTDEHRHA